MEFTDLKEIAVDLMKAMCEHSLTKLTLKQGELELTLEKAGITVASHMMPAPIPIAQPHVEDAVGTTTMMTSKEPEGRFVTSPVVGTFYTSQAPGEPPFVRVGDTINEDTVVGIIEAMKVMNEVKAGIKGIVAEVLIDNAHPVEFGTHLFRVK